MKKMNAMLIAGSLLIAGALSSPASAYDNYGGYNNSNYSNYNNNYNQGSLSRFINRASDRLIGQPILGNRWNNGNYCDNNSNGGYYRPGIVSRIWNRIF